MTRRLLVVELKQRAKYRGNPWSDYHSRIDFNYQAETIEKLVGLVEELVAEAEQRALDLGRR